MTEWNINNSRDLYNIAQWGEGYFGIDTGGNFVVHPNPDKEKFPIPLSRVVEMAERRSLSLPLLVRFSGILHHRLNKLETVFSTAIRNNGWQSTYTAAYPIKVNQQHSVIDELLSASENGLALEVGSKTELIAVLSVTGKVAMIICNGYKDSEYIRLALIGQAIGHRVYIVIEKLSELEMVLNESSALGIRPVLGARLRLASIAKGNWQNSGGDKSKFGLTASEVLKVIGRLKSVNGLEWLDMMHFHMGSQISDIRDIRAGIKEAAQYFYQLYDLDVRASIINIGGGLGVDYEGSQSRNYCSINYSLEEYAETIVSSLSEICRKRDLPLPNLVSESGRALTAHHAMLVTNVLEVERLPTEMKIPGQNTTAGSILELAKILQNQPKRPLHQNYHDAVEKIGEIQGEFANGELSLLDRAEAEHLFYLVCAKILQELSSENPMHRQIREELKEKLADKYFLNLSIFQSLPDSWAIDQVFPVIPLQNLDQHPSREATIEDITCDSDGRIDTFPRNGGLSPTLPLHEIKKGQKYLLGIFLLGAYQEILGDIHNLFGDTDSIHVEYDEKDGYIISHAIKGDRADELLRLVHFNPEVMRQVFQNKINASDLSPQQQTQYLDMLEHGLTGYTYLED